MDTKDDIFGGFSAIASDLSGKTSDNNYLDDEMTNGRDAMRKPPLEEDEEDDALTPEELEALAASKKKVVKKTGDEDEDEDEDKDEDEEGDEDEDESKKKPSTDDEDGVSAYEPELAEYLQEELYEEFGLDMEGKDVPKFKSLSEVVAFVKETIADNSTPEYASDDVANIDAYVKNGGDFYSYVQSMYGTPDLNSLDLDDIEVQKSIVREDLLNRGMSEARVNKRIERMEDTDILLEEAEDSLESLKEFKVSQEETLLKEQQKAALKAEQDNLDFVNSVEVELEAIKDVNGHPISKAEKNKLFNYMLKPTANGVPQYHIDYRKSRKHMIESAYFTMMGDKLTKKVETKAKSKATKKLKDRLADKPRGVNQSTSHSGSTDAFSSIFKALR